MRVELPKGYVPPQPTHPHYGYLTPQERAELEQAEQRSPRAPSPTEAVAEPQIVVTATTQLPAETQSDSEIPQPSSADPAAEAARHTGWVPQPPSPPRTPSTPQATSTPVAAEMRWDAYRQEWVAAEETAPPPDVAAAAGGRGSSSSWTSADGQRFRWDARAQEWVTERPEG